jgi:D-aminopeptidase
MRIYFSADLEGVTGVTHSQDAIPGRSQYERFRRLLLAADMAFKMSIGVMRLSRSDPDYG